MSKLETTNPAEPAADIDCATATSLVKRFLLGDEDVEQRASLRAHLASCAACKAQYRSAVETLAQLARGPRRTSSPSVQGRAGFSRWSFGSRKPGKIGMIAIPVAAIACIYWMVGGGPAVATAELKVLAGHVQVGETILDTSSARLRLSGSQGGRTDETGRARIDAGSVHVEIEPSTAFATERLNPLRMRLFDGRLSLAGTLAVTTHVGVLELSDGRANVALDERGLTLENVSGKLVYADRTGMQEIAAGELLWVPISVAGSR